MITPDAVANYLAANIHTRAEVLAWPSPVPAEPGVYGWWFDELPYDDMPIANCKVRGGLVLLYAGISPKEPPKNGRPPSRETLQSRIRTHYTGNAEGSTLRRTLGCLLEERLEIELRRYGSGTRLHFGAGERDLSRWMDENAYVSWLPMSEPWLLEAHLLETLDLPLNLDKNKRHPFHRTLTAIRAEAAMWARAQAVLPNPASAERGSAKAVRSSRSVRPATHPQRLSTVADHPLASRVAEHRHQPQLQLGVDGFPDRAWGEGR